MKSSSCFICDGSFTHAKLSRVNLHVRASQREESFSPKELLNAVYWLCSEVKGHALAFCAGEAQNVMKASDPEVM